MFDAVGSKSGLLQRESGRGAGDNAEDHKRPPRHRGRTIPMDACRLLCGGGAAGELSDESSAAALEAVEDRASAASFSSEITAALRGLGALQRAVVVALFGLDGGGERSVVEVARALGRSPGQIIAIEQRALGTLSHTSLRRWCAA